MRGLALLPFLACLAASAQNWALLNPDYKYNYSNDGSDTISNQIFVTHIDTLGVDSFRYELNRIGVVCDTCPAALAELTCDTCGFLEADCNGCFVWTDQPQFLGYNCIHAGHTWYFNAQDTFKVEVAAGVGTTWTFNSSTAVTATVVEEWATNTFGTIDTLQRISLSSGDSLIISRSFGLLQFRVGTQLFGLIGVEGAGVGHLFPDPMAYFDYEAGDVLTYKIFCNYWCSNPGDNPYPQIISYYQSISITGRSEYADTVDYTTSTARTYPNPGPSCSLMACPDWPMPLDHWIFDPTGVANDHPILEASPGQVLDSTICQPIWWLLTRQYMAEHGMNDQGRTIMRSHRLGYHLGYPTSGIWPQALSTPGLYQFDLGTVMNVLYEEGIGLRKVERIDMLGLVGVSIELVGAIIDGDTIIQPPAIQWAVDIPEIKTACRIYPNPAVNEIVIDDPTMKEAGWRIVSASGTEVSHGVIIGPTSYRIDVSDLPEGVYVLVLTTNDGVTAQRFIIAR